jgi:hypothetical protein
MPNLRICLKVEFNDARWGVSELLGILETDMPNQPIEKAIIDYLKTMPGELIDEASWVVALVES